MSPERENLKAGLFVVVGVTLAVAVIFVLSDLERLLEPKRTVRVYFELTDGLQGLKEAAAVTLGDQPIGQVVSIRDKTEGAPDGAKRVVGKVVTAKIPGRYNLYQNAVIELKAPLLGSGTTLNIRSVGDGQPHTGQTPIAGGIAGNAQVQELVREAGILEPQRQQIRRIIANIESVTVALRDDLPTIVQSARQAAVDLRQMAADGRQAVAQIRQRQAVWMQRIDAITVAADESLATVGDLVRDKSPQLRTALENIHDVSGVVKDQTMVQVTQMLDRATAAVDDFKAASAQVRQLLVGQRPVMERTLANAQLTSDQLKLAAIEVRRSPWRLLYEPDEKELDSDNIYDAARSFALAAGVLDATTQSLQAIVNDDATDAHELQRMVEHLDAIFSKFKQTETAFWNAVKVNPGVP